MMIRNVELADAAAIAEIYNHYIHKSIITFEEDAVGQAEMTKRILATQAQQLPWYVAEDDDQKCLGYCYASKWKGRGAYRFSVEITLYLHHDKVGNGAGTSLYKSLFADLKSRDFHVVIGGIALPNPASIRLHEKFGMKKVAHFEDVGFKFGEWVDVGYWQRRLADYDI